MLSLDIVVDEDVLAEIGDHGVHGFRHHRCRLGGFLLLLLLWFSVPKLRECERIAGGGISRLVGCYFRGVPMRTLWRWSFGWLVSGGLVEPRWRQLGLRVTFCEPGSDHRIMGFVNLTTRSYRLPQ